MAVGAALAVAAPSRAEAVRWTLGFATEFTPVVIDPGRPADLGTPVRIGVRPIIDLELNHYVAFGAYAPFTVVRTGEGAGAASSGAESVFGLSASLRYAWIFEAAPEELLVYAQGRGGFGTIAGRAGPYFGGAVGASLTWLDTGRGLFAELSAGHITVADASVVGGLREVSRTTFTITAGVVFRLGGEDWWLNRPRDSRAE